MGTKPSNKTLLKLFFAVFFLLILSLTLFILRQNTQIQNKAAGNDNPSTNSSDYLPTILDKQVNMIITSRNVVLSWVTDFPTSSFIAYDQTPSTLTGDNPNTWGFSRIHQNTNPNELATNHKLIISDLIPKTLYFYRVSGQNFNNESGWISNSQINSLTTTSEPAIYSGPQVISAKSRSVTISWTTNFPTTSLVAFGTNPESFASSNYLEWGDNLISQDDTPDDFSSLTSTHTVNLDNLNPNTTYYYRAGGNDTPFDGGSQIFSSVKSFVTK
jgi:hypothetical protein